MTDVENAWDRYQGAKTALLTSLSSEFNTPPPILSLAPSERLFYRENAHRSVQNMSAFCQRIQTTIDELHHFKQAMTHYIRQATLSLVPISAIPFEILRSIFAYAVDGPGDANSILQLSHVSRTWRTVALETSELFTHADWNHWNVALVHLWNEKAKHHPLSITIDATTFRALFYTKGHAQIETEKKRAFHAALPRCASLSLTIEGPKTSDIQTPIFHPIPMFAPRCTRLQDLSITYTGGLLSLDLSGFTTVKHLHLHRVIEAFTREMEIESFVCATDATGFFYDTLRFLPHLRSLSICQLVVDVVLAGTSIVHLDALERLEIRQLPQARATVLLLLLAQMKTPNVEHLTLNGLSLSKVEESRFWRQVVSTTLSSGSLSKR
ncbi:hypothetical protein DL93DRAFT_1981458 [Clavulina sp. PMI_390]|nr:hypothetical protein DL93DRAFT_1981458 [Clavulina sp. PMI_390]